MASRDLALDRLSLLGAMRRRNLEIAAPTRVLPPGNLPASVCLN